MNVAWMLVLITAASPAEYSVEPIAKAESMADCYYRSTEVEWERYMQDNQELLCIRMPE